jgi:hypothetical protein
LTSGRHPWGMSAPIIPRLSVVPIPSVADTNNVAAAIAREPHVAAVAPPAIAAAGAPFMTPIPVFDPTAGMRPPPQQFRQRPDALRPPRPGASLTRREHTARRPPASASDLAPADLMEQRLDEAAGALLSVLRRRGEMDTTTGQDQRYDPLERYQLLQAVLQRLDNEDMPADEKKRVAQRVHALSDELQRKHGDDLERARPALALMKDTIDEMGLAGLSADALRARLGSAGKPLEPMELATKLLDQVGEERFAKALATVSTGTLAVLRTRTGGPKLWMSLKDADAIRTIYSSTAAAGDLRAKLGAINVRPRTSRAGMALQLMSIAQSGKLKATSLIAEMIKVDELTPLALARTYVVVRETIAGLPLTMWPADKSARLEILAELHGQVTGAYARMPARPTRDQRREQALREWALREHARPEAAR